MLVSRIGCRALRLVPARHYSGGRIVSRSVALEAASITSPPRMAIMHGRKDDEESGGGSYHMKASATASDNTQETFRRHIETTRLSKKEIIEHQAASSFIEQSSEENSHQPQQASIFISQERIQEKREEIIIQQQDEQATAVVVVNTSDRKALSFYRRQLPTSHCVAFSSTEGRNLFQEALREGGLESYFPLSEQFKTQDDPAFCGLGALTMVLNALAIDPGRTWKGPWRWFDESMLECCEPLEVVRTKGICINKLDCLARCNGATTMLKYGDVTGLDEFREDIIRMTSSIPPPNELIIVGYNRKLMGQTGTGHFSPIGGYHSGRDMALIMDVARFKYPPHWVHVPMLWEAMKTVDPETQRSRGYMIVGKGTVSESLLFTIDKARYREWSDLSSWLRDAADRLPHLIGLKDSNSELGAAALAATFPLDHARVLPVFLESLPPSVASMVTTYHEAMEVNYSEHHLRSIHQLLEAIELHPVYEAIEQHDELLLRFKEGWGGCCARKVVNEKQVLTIIYISVMEWILMREGRSLVGVFPDATYSPILCVEVSQLKRKFAAMSTSKHHSREDRANEHV